MAPSGSPAVRPAVLGHRRVLSCAFRSHGLRVFAARARARSSLSRHVGVRFCVPALPPSSVFSSLLVPFLRGRSTAARGRCVFAAPLGGPLLGGPRPRLSSSPLTSPTTRPLLGLCGSVALPGAVYLQCCLSPPKHCFPAPVAPRSVQSEPWALPWENVGGVCSRLRRGAWPRIARDQQRAWGLAVLPPRAALALARSGELTQMGLGHPGTSAAP